MKIIETIKIHLSSRKLCIMKVSSNFRSTSSPDNFILIALSTLYIWSDRNYSGAAIAKNIHSLF